MEGIINQINKDLKESLKKHIGSKVEDAMELMKKEVCEYLKQFYIEPEFDIKVSQDPKDDSKLIVKINSNE